jgi:hypothetical protein
MPSGFLYDMRDAESYTLNPAGLCVVQALSEKRDPDLLWRQLMDRFEVTEEHARRDAAGFVAELRSLRLLVHEGEPA